MVDTGIMESQLVDPWQAKIAWASEDDICGMWGTVTDACNWPCAGNEVGGVLWQPDYDGCLIMAQRLLHLRIFCSG